jgi:hypothetical protein
MKYYALAYDMNGKDPDEGSILWETESESMSETMSLVKVMPGFEYEVVTEQDILEEVQKYYDTDAEVYLH